MECVMASYACLALEFILGFGINLLFFHRQTRQPSWTRTRKRSI